MARAQGWDAILGTRDHGALRDDDGQLQGFAKITRDITERKQNQEALERAREALFQAQKMEAIGSYRRSRARLQQPADGRSWQSGAAGKRLPNDDKMRALLSNAIQGAQRGAALTQRMLSFARRQEVKLEPVEVVGLVRGMSDLLAALARQWHCHRDPVSPPASPRHGGPQPVRDRTAQSRRQRPRCDARWRAGYHRGCTGIGMRDQRD